MEEHNIRLPSSAAMAASRSLLQGSNKKTTKTMKKTGSGGRRGSSTKSKKKKTTKTTTKATATNTASASNNAANNNAISVSDVLCGRGGLTNSHVGNKEFRFIVAEYTDEYLYAKKKQKKVIAERIVQRVRDNGGRFLQRCANSDIWAEVTQTKALEKSKQALREGLDVRHKTIRPEKHIHRRDSESSTEEENPRKRARLVQGIVVGGGGGSSTTTTTTTSSRPSKKTTIRLKLSKSSKKSADAKAVRRGSGSGKSSHHEYEARDEDHSHDEDHNNVNNYHHQGNNLVPEVPDLVHDYNYNESAGDFHPPYSHSNNYRINHQQQQEHPGQEQQQYRTPRLTPSLASLSSQYQSTSYYPESYRPIMEPSSSSVAGTAGAVGTDTSFLQDEYDHHGGYHDYNNDGIEYDHAGI